MEGSHVCLYISMYIPIDINVFILNNFFNCFIMVKHRSSVFTATL